jgi:arabinose-5-phosphate isomerase
MLAAGDAMAAGLMAAQGFSKARYADYHPGGMLGQKLLTTLQHVMSRGERLPRIAPDCTVREAIQELSSKRLGAVFVVEADGMLKGIFTDGDLRRLVCDGGPVPLERSIGSVMTQRPRLGTPGMLASDALVLMEENLITVLPVVESTAAGSHLLGAVHMHDLVRLGLTAED